MMCCLEVFYASVPFEQLCDSDDDEDDIPNFENDFGRNQVQKANWQVMNISTPANYFHALRRQQHRDFRKPLVIASPKNLFRLRQCVSPLADMGPGVRFKRLIPERDPEITANPDEVDRLVFCSGKLYYELVAEREQLGLKNVAIVTLEQIAPFPFDRVKTMMEMFPNVDMGDGVHPGNVIWCQEEPKNMGAWSYVRPRFVTTAREGLDKDMVMRYVGRRAAASPATGYPKLHNAEQEALVKVLFVSDAVLKRWWDTTMRAGLSSGPTRCWATKPEVKAVAANSGVSSELSACIALSLAKSLFVQRLSASGAAIVNESAGNGIPVS
ncbi:2-oxoglutarate dehydrogenase, mitochondrial [Symbiodinium microadriaticum]|uniref:2-oxoglutarate dehydrogenase, mitochondrial n=1 Tax=Symbiodinium microadriaticum TaxID=2951 RepID=A0A1Q9EYF0_SYMMI|nr:2-oxoglutarate dehydrogenase, mitochondrial [Symbiodinium microadriaticum]